LRGLLLGEDGFQHISRFGDMRKINLRLDSFGFLARRASGLRTLAITGGLEVRPDFLRFVVFKRAGMGLLLGDADFRQHIENGFAFDFQFSRQIVNSNFTHPPLCPSGLFPLSLHINLTV
jgi:hypothetical protein